MASVHAANPLLVAELIALVCAHLSPRSLARAARVCRLWTDPALAALWHTLDDLRPFLALLAPLTAPQRRSTRKSMAFTKFIGPLGESDWVRADRYAYRIRVIDLDDRRIRYRPWDPSVFTELERTCPRQEILPNLVSASFMTTGTPHHMQRFLLFLYPGLRHLAFDAIASQERPLSGYVDGVVRKAPHLTRLEIRSRHAMHVLEEDLSRLCRQLRNLRHIIAPLYFLTGVLLSTLASAPELECIELALPIEGGVGDRADVNEIQVDFAPGSFPSLRSLSFTAHVQNATNLLKHPSAPLRLTLLHLHVLAISSPPLLLQLFKTVAARYDRLTTLSIDFMLGPHSPIRASPPEPHERPSLETLRPLTACASLKTLEIRWDYELDLTDADLAALAPCWPALEVLHLHSDAIPEPTPPRLTLRALLPLAEHLPRLRGLALHLDGDAGGLPEPHIPLPAFRALHTLALGSSPLRAAAPAALALSALLPAHCTVSAGVRWPDAFGIALDRAGVVDERRLSIAEWWSRWNEVGRLVPVLVRARADERERVRAALRVDEVELEEEVMRLRMRDGSAG